MRMTKWQWVLHCLVHHAKRKQIIVEQIFFLGVPIEEWHKCSCGNYWVWS